MAAWPYRETTSRRLNLWELTTGKHVRVFGDHGKPVTSVSFSPDGHWGLSSSKDKTLRLWELATGRCVHTFEGHTEEVRSGSFDPYGCWVLSGSGADSGLNLHLEGRDTTVRLWEMDTGKYVQTVEKHTLDGFAKVVGREFTTHTVCAYL